MQVKVKISGELGRAKVQCELEVPDNWKPTFNEFCKVKGALRMLTEKLSREFSPPPEVN